MNTLEQPAAPQPAVSVIIPAYNAAATIAETLASLCAQTYPHWEAIVVDDGSRDDTVAVVEGLAASVPGLRLIRQANAGVSVARNTGIAAARHAWLLFLDADDLITPDHLERLTAALRANPAADASYGGWARLAPDGALSSEAIWSESGDLFDAFARFTVFAIHACIVRRSLVLAVGGFDPALPTCEDWDLWLRLARAGAHFEATTAVVALYRMRATSASSNYQHILTNGLHVLRISHGPDPRVPPELNRHPAGRSRDLLALQSFIHACWSAGLALGDGGDARPLLDLLGDLAAPELDASSVAGTLIEALKLSTCRRREDWPALWPTVEGPLLAFLRALEARAGNVGLARRAQALMEQMVLGYAPDTRPLRIGISYAVTVELTAPLEDLVTPLGVERIYLDLMIEGEHFASALLPVCDGVLPAAVLADNVAGAYAWELLGRFFARTLYPRLRVERTAQGASVYRDRLLLSAGLPPEAAANPEQLHAAVGWTVAMQELWGRPDLNGTGLYNTSESSGPPPQRRAAGARTTIEVSAELPELTAADGTLEVSLTVAGEPIGIVPVAVKRGHLSAAQLRSALLSAGGMELLRAAVRAGVIGRPFTAEPVALRARLAAAGRAPWGAEPPPGLPTMVLTNRTALPIGTSASRRAALPAACAADLAAAASALGEGIAGSAEAPARVLYAPSVIAAGAAAPQTPEDPAPAGAPRPTRPYDRRFFERQFAQLDDTGSPPGPFEQTRHEQALGLLPAGPFETALELGCGAGHLTERLAPRVGRLVAADIARIALERAARRCAGHGNISYAHLDVTRDALGGPFDLIVCDGLLSYIGERAELRATAKKIADALRPGGHLLLIHPHQRGDDPRDPGLDWGLPAGAKVIGEACAAVRGLRLVRELRTPAYRAHLLRREQAGLLPWLRPGPEVTVARHATPLPPEATRPAGTGAQSDTLPVLVYHGVAPAGDSASRGRWVTPEAFAEQLRYLHESGYYSVTPEQWRAAAAQSKPLAGRPVLITFDDARADFATHAWPLLKRYGLGAMVFVATRGIEEASGEPPPLTWEAARALRAEGVLFGSYGVSGAALAGLSPAEVVSEGIRSRAALSQALGAPVHACAYPGGETDAAAQHLMGACGYIFGFTREARRCHPYDPLLALPRIAVRGNTDLRAFVANLEG